MTVSMTSDEGSLLDHLVARELPNADSLSDLCAVLPGFFPSDVAEAVNRSMTAKLERNLARHPSWSPLVETKLPLPHPLDFEWRFSLSCVRQIARAIEGLEGPIGMLGTPFLAEQLGYLPCGPHRLTLFERRVEACAAISESFPGHIRCGDLAAYEGPDRFALLIADPPWYPPIIRLFLERAASMLGLGGQLWLCLPGIGARPTVASERSELAHRADLCGFALTELRPRYLRYDAPVFERSALLAQGLQEVQSDWRTGDLLILTKVRSEGERTRYELHEAEWTNVDARTRRAGKPPPGLLTKVPSRKHSPDPSSQPEQLLFLLRGSTGLRTRYFFAMVR